jgi:hypothetical protein
VTGGDLPIAMLRIILAIAIGQRCSAVASPPSLVPGDVKEWSVFEITPQAAESAMGDDAAAAPAPG